MLLRQQLIISPRKFADFEFFLNMRHIRILHSKSHHRPVGGGYPKHTFKCERPNRWSSTLTCTLHQDFCSTPNVTLSVAHRNYWLENSTDRNALSRLLIDSRMFLPTRNRWRRSLFHFRVWGRMRPQARERQRVKVQIRPLKSPTPHTPTTHRGCFI